MRKFLSQQFSIIHRFLSKFPGFSNPEKHSLAFLNASQFLGALNDNMYKFALIYFLIDLQGKASANTILSAAGAIFVIPFLLFSSIAGILADRYSKSRLIIIIKAAEVIVVILAIFAFALKLTWTSYAILFLLASLGAAFGPSKYGVIPELVTKNQVPKANGWITSFTYLAIILGTFFASFITEMTNRNYILVGLFCLFIAIIGFISSFGIKYTPPKGSKKKVDFFFIRDIFNTLVACKEEKHLLISIFGAAFFFFIGGFTQLNIIPFAIESLGLTEIAGGYLFLVTALGIAAGSVFSARVSKKQVELGVVCFAGILISIFFLLLSFSKDNIYLAIVSLFLIGFAGGNFAIPFDSFIQLFSPEHIRGRVIAASNFLSFVGVLIASLCLYLFNGIFNLSAEQSFVVMFILTFFFTIFLCIRISDLFLSWTARTILYKFLSVKEVNLNLVHTTKNPVLMLEEGSFFKSWLLYGMLPNIHLLIPQYKTRSFPWFQRMFYSIHRIDAPQKFEELIKHSKSFRDPHTIPCIYLLKKKPVPDKQLFPAFFIRKHYEVISVNFEKVPDSKEILIRFSK